MGLEELGGLVEGGSLLALLGLLLVHDRFESLALPALLDSLGPLLADLAELVLGVLAISLSLLFLLGLLAHLRVVRVECLRVLFISTIVRCEQNPLARRVLLFDGSELSCQLIDRVLQSDHLRFMSLFALLLQCLTRLLQLILFRVLLRPQVSLRRFKVLDLLKTSFLVLLGILLELAKLVHLVFKRLCEIFNTLA